MNYYQNKFRAQVEMIDCLCWLLKWTLIGSLLLWLGGKM
jgi:hypothetical protein